MLMTGRRKWWIGLGIEFLGAVAAAAAVAKRKRRTTDESGGRKKGFFFMRHCVQLGGEHR